MCLVDARRWITKDYDYMRERLGMSRDAATCRARALAAVLAPIVGDRTVLAYQLDNPYRSTDALKVLLNEVKRERYIAPRRPVASAPAAKMGSREAVA